MAQPNLIAMERQKRAAEKALDEEVELGRSSLANFVKAAWHVLEPGTELKWGWALDAMCKCLEAVTDGRIKRLLINVPPGMMKSLIVNVFWPAWEWGPRGMGHIRYIGVSFALDGLSDRDSRKMRKLITSDWYQNRWPIGLTKNTETEFETEAMGFRLASPADSSTGKRGDRLLIDDPINPEWANRENYIADRERWFRETIRSRINDPETSAIVIIMQRLHQKDTSGIILEEGFDYVHLCLPMEFESNRRCEIHLDGDLFFSDPRKYDGQLVFPERFTREYVEEEKKLLGEYGIAGQFQQRPAPRGGGIFKRSYFIARWEELPSMRYRIIFVDTASKTKEQNDFSVFEEWGLGKFDNKAYLCDLMRGKWEAPELLKAARVFWKKCHSRNRLVYGVLRNMRIEDKSSGIGLLQQLRRGDAATGATPIPVKEIPRNAGLDKIARARDIAPYCEAGLVLLPKDEPWLPELERELFTFPKAGHDDQVDPFCDAVAEFFGGPRRTMDGVE